jgi:hypothetical protein
VRGPLGLLSGAPIVLGAGGRNCFERNQVDEFELGVEGAQDCGAPITEVRGAARDRGRGEGGGGKVGERGL